MVEASDFLVINLRLLILNWFYVMRILDNPEANQSFHIIISKPCKINSNQDNC